MAHCCIQTFAAIYKMFMPACCHMHYVACCACVLRHTDVLCTRALRRRIEIRGSYSVSRGQSEVKHSLQHLAPCRCATLDRGRRMAIRQLISTWYVSKHWLSSWHYSRECTTTHVHAHAHAHANTTPQIRSRTSVMPSRPSSFLRVSRLLF